MKLPNHKCGLTLEHNVHLQDYMTAEQQIEEWDRNNSGPEWISAEAKQRSLETNEIWSLHWYPRTAISFYYIAAPTLEELLDYAAKDDEP